MTPSLPRVSIVMPVYNAAKYLRRSLEDIRAQSCKDFEVLCVDDGSTDQSLDILHEYTAHDSRFFVYTQNHQYAGPARNLGIRHARGEYLLFLDSDDRFHPNLLKASLEQIERHQADICIFRAEGLDERTQKRWSMTHSLDLSYVPREVFSGRDIPKYIFNLTTPAPWNKLFRTDFVRRHGLTFQETPNSEDLAFVLSALALAERITFLNKIFLTYRVNNTHSLEGSKDKAPLAFYESLTEFRRRLKEYGLYERYEQSYINLAASNCIYNLQTLRNTHTYENIFYYLKNTALEELNITGHPEDYFYATPEYELPKRIQTILSGSILDYLSEFRVDLPGLRKSILQSVSGRELIHLLSERIKKRL